ncbi:SGNH/GDSL hydrolase family protein [Prosthecomicrobium sp. N25]|uniref:SGNH/GDSL hydrolase family protein n=1 Tax=Prosthecomicrobium sp. N25 TaxID=3129254 RepID=UPI003076E09C
MLRSSDPLLRDRRRSRLRTGLRALLIAAAVMIRPPLAAAEGPDGSAAPPAAAPFKCGEASVRLPLDGALARTGRLLAAHAHVQVLAIGSSSTQGVGASAPTKAYPAQLQAELRRRFPGADIAVRNAGIGGETIERTYARLLAELDTTKPDLVIWQVGTNDALTADAAEDKFAAVLQAGLDAIQERGIDIVVVDQQFYKTVRDPARYERFVRMVEKVAADEKICLFPRYRIMRSWAAESSGRLETMLAADGFHMNDNGYACVADLLAEQIYRIVSEKRS